MEKIIWENAFEENKIIDLRTTGHRTLEARLYAKSICLC